MAHATDNMIPNTGGSLVPEDKARLPEPLTDYLLSAAAAAEDGGSTVADLKKDLSDHIDHIGQPDETGRAGGFHCI